MKRLIKVVIPMVCIVFAIILSLRIITIGGSNSSGNKHLDLGSKLLETGEYEEAILEFNKTIEIEPNNANAYIGLGKAYARTNEWEKSHENLAIARDIQPEDEELNNSVLLLEKMIYLDGNPLDNKEDLLRLLEEISISPGADSATGSKLQNFFKNILDEAFQKINDSIQSL